MLSDAVTDAREGLAHWRGRPRPGQPRKQVGVDRHIERHEKDLAGALLNSEEERIWLALMTPPRGMDDNDIVRYESDGSMSLRYRRVVDDEGKRISDGPASWGGIFAPMTPEERS